MKRSIRVSLPLILLLLCSPLLVACNETNIDKHTSTSGGPDNKVMEIARNLVISARERKNGDAFFEKLRQLTYNDLREALVDDQHKKAFWINVYNGSVQHWLKENPELFEDRGRFYAKPRIEIAGEHLSLDDIEHGMIRGSKIKLSLGLLKNPFVGRFERAFRVAKTDGRIHFALNCGAKSCPYVGIYNFREIDRQLDIVAKDYLENTTQIDGNTVRVTSLFSWFRGDFGNKKGIVRFLKKYDIIPQNMQPKLEYLPYDWTLETGNFMDIDQLPKD